jgi:hypothetical protein
LIHYTLLLDVHPHVPAPNHTYNIHFFEEEFGMRNMLFITVIEPKKCVLYT